MARLHEYQGKALLKSVGINIPAGGIAATPEKAGTIAAELGRPVVVKIQAWTTARQAIGGIRFADTAAQARDAARDLLGMRVGAFTVDKVIVEEKLPIAQEFYAAVVIDDAAARPMVMFSIAGGSGIEDRAGSGIVTRHLDVVEGLPDYEARNMARSLGLRGNTQRDVAAALVRLVALSRRTEGRTAEINPLVLTEGGRIFAADCRITVDDYAVFRHPELGIEVARELDHPPTPLERIAYQVESADHRGTFYFVQMVSGFEPAEHYLGFHGAGGGGSMMSMDAISGAGFGLANFTDTSGNPSASKVYRAARIILAQPNIVGYFGSGSGVASQEQYHSAYGLAKAFHETNLSIPAVVRLGGNSEDRAVQILSNFCKHLPGKVEGYRKDDTPAFCAQRMRSLVDEGGAERRTNLPGPIREWNHGPNVYSFKINGGSVHIDHDQCDEATNALLLEYGKDVFKIENGRPVLNLTEKEVAGKDSELIACEVECRGRANDAIYVELPIHGLDDYVKSAGAPSLAQQGVGNGSPTGRGR